MSQTYVIIGASAAGISALNQLRLIDKTSTIVCISRETELPYNKCRLVHWCSQKIERRALDLAYAKDERTIFRLGETVTQILVDQCVVVLRSGEQIPYDRLLIASGSAPRIPQLFDMTLPGIFSFYTMRDVELIDAYITSHKPQTAVIVGAGATGIECADALRHRDITVTLIEQAPALMAGWQDEAASRFLHNRLERTGIKIIVHEKIQKIEKISPLLSIQCMSGMTIEADMIIYAGGAYPVTDFVDKTIIECAQEALVVNEYMQTNIPSIYAAGDCALVRNKVTGERMRTRSWPDAVTQGMHAAYAMSGYGRIYEGAIAWLTSSGEGWSFCAAGRVDSYQEGNSLKEETADQYAKYIHNAAQRLCGFILIGTLEHAMHLRKQLNRQ